MKEEFFNKGLGNFIKTEKIEGAGDQTIKDLILNVVKKVEKGEPLTEEDKNLFNNAINTAIGFAEQDNDANHDQIDSINSNNTNGETISDSREAPHNVGL